MKTIRKIKRYLYTRTLPLVMFLVIIEVLIFKGGMLANAYAIENEIQKNEAQIIAFKMAQYQKIAGRSAELELALKVATAEPRPQILTKAEADEMIDSMFPAQFRERFKKITQTCENGKLKSDAQNINKDGTKDVGLSQINDYWHTKRVEKMFGLEFRVAMEMPILNYIYAAYLVEHDQNTHAWACDNILEEKGVIPVL